MENNMNKTNKLAWKYFFEKNKEGSLGALFMLFVGGLMFSMMGVNVDITWVVRLGAIMMLIPLLIVLVKFVGWFIEDWKESKAKALKDLNHDKNVEGEDHENN